MATSKKYNEFPEGSYDQDKIILQANDTDGALEFLYVSELVPPTPTLQQVMDAGSELTTGTPGVTLDSLDYFIVRENSTTPDYKAQVYVGNNRVMIAIEDKTGADRFALVQVKKYDEITFGIELQAYDEGEAVNVSITKNQITISPQNSTQPFKVSIQGLKSFASNAAAQGGGLVEFDIYRNGDNLCMVHP